MASLDVPKVTVPAASDEKDSDEVVQWDKLSDKEKAYIATLSDSDSPLHSDECLDYIMQRLLKLALDGLIFDGIEVVNQLESLINYDSEVIRTSSSSSSSACSSIEEGSKPIYYEPPFEVMTDEEVRLVREFVVSAKGTGLNLSEAFYTHPLIIDIKQKHLETLAMLDFMQGTVVKSRDIATSSISAQSRTEDITASSTMKKSSKKLKKKKRKSKSPKKRKSGLMSLFDLDSSSTTMSTTTTTTTTTTTMMSEEESQIGDEWQLISDDGEWKSEYVINEELNTHSYRVTGIGKVPAFNICALFVELDLLNEWVPLAKETLDLGALSKYSKTGYVRVGLIWPLSDRETMIYGYGVDDLERNNRLLIFFDSRESELDEGFRNDLKEQIKKKKRSAGLKIEIHLGGFLLEIIDEEHTKITVVFNCDPKVSLPYSVLNWFCGQFISVFLKKLVECANFKPGSPYLQRIQDKPELYGHIRDNITSKSPSSPSASVGPLDADDGTDLTSKGPADGFPAVVPES